MALRSATATRYVALGWGLFGGTHLAMSHGPLRDGLISALGEPGFKGAYSAVSLATFVPTSVLYFRYGRGRGNISGWTSLVKSNAAVQRVGVGCKALGAIVFGQSLSMPNPVAELNDPNHDKSLEQKVEVRGVTRIVRHPMFCSFALLGIGNVLTRGHAGDVVYWAGFPLLYAVGTAHQDARQRSTLPARFYEETSAVPFAAILEGRNSIQAAFQELSVPALATAVAAPLFLL